ncbi:MAG: YhfC family intramembrane metalloprotease [Roseiflexaceae bacterium]
METLTPLSGAFIAFTVVSAIIAIVLPPVLAFVAGRRLGASWRFVGYGALIFLVFQILTRIPLVQVLQLVLAPHLAGSIGLQVAWVAALALSAGVFEEVGRYVGYRWLFKPEQRTWDNAVMYGLGHGGIESILLVGGAVVLSLIGLLTIQSSGLGVIPENLRPQVAAQFAAAAEAPAWLQLAGGWERIGAITFHVAMSVVGLQVFRRGSLRWLGLAVLLHTLFNLTVLVRLLGLSQVTTILIIEGLLTLMSLGMLWLIFRLREPGSHDMKQAEGTSPVVV